MSAANNRTVRKLTVLYGSQTGTAQDVAEQIGRDAVRYHLNVTVQALDNYNIVRFLKIIMFIGQQSHVAHLALSVAYCIYHCGWFDGRTFSAGRNHKSWSAMLNHFEFTQVYCCGFFQLK